MKLYCVRCEKFMAEIRDASVRNGMVVLCARCYRALIPSNDIPEFLSGLFKGRK